MTVQTITAGGAHVATLHTPYQCPACHEPLGVLWVHTAAGMVPQACDLAAHPVAFCPRCGEAVDVARLWGPAQDGAQG